MISANWSAASLADSAGGTPGGETMGAVACAHGGDNSSAASNSPPAAAQATAREPGCESMRVNLYMAERLRFFDLDAISESSACPCTIKGPVPDCERSLGGARLRRGMGIFGCRRLRTQLPPAAVS